MGFSGMIWFDNTKGRSILDKARGAITWYQRRFGKKPQICLVNVNQFAELGASEIDGIPLRACKYCLPNHFMPGFDSPVPPAKYEASD